LVNTGANICRRKHTAKEIKETSLATDSVWSYILRMELNSCGMGVISFGWSYNFFQKLELNPFGIGIISPITGTSPFERS
jgi:hypothetical protein